MNERFVLPRPALTRPRRAPITAWNLVSVLAFLVRARAITRRVPSTFASTSAEPFARNTGIVPSPPAADEGTEGGPADPSDRPLSYGDFIPSSRLNTRTPITLPDSP